MRSTRYLASAAAVAVACAAAVANANAPEATRIGAGPHLFVDDALVAKRTGLARNVHACEKLPSPVLEPEAPWEASRVYMYGSAIPNPKGNGFHLRDTSLYSFSID